jgi:hypothetical protein
MLSLHDYIAERLAEKVAERRVVVWYDESAEFAPFVEELRGGPRTAAVAPVQLGGQQVWLAEYAGSMFEVRFAVEPHIKGDTPDQTVIYLPGQKRDEDAWPLMELDLAGTKWLPMLRLLARNLLARRLTTAAVDAMLVADRKLAYPDLARIIAAGDEGSAAPSVLRSIFAGSGRADDAMMLSWLADGARDEEIAGKDALPELREIVQRSIGLGLPADADVAKLRAITTRYLLANEFRLGLSCPAPAAFDGVPVPAPSDAAESVARLAAQLRLRYPKAYPALADQVERELGLADTPIPPEALGSTDTFRCSGGALLAHCSDLVAWGAFDEALAFLSRHDGGFWLSVDVERQAAWEAVRRMAELGQLATKVRAEVESADRDPNTWVRRYTAADGWHRLDRAQRRLEAWLAQLDELPERPLRVVRHAYDDACHHMAVGFTRALTDSGWAVAGIPSQTRTFADAVAPQPKPVAYFLVDAMRYEMGLELATRLPAGAEQAVRPALAVLPTITPIGMAALAPSAAVSFSLATSRDGQRLGAEIDGTFLPGLPERKKFAAARVPGLVDLDLNELLSLPGSRLAKKIDGAQVVVVRSQEIDHAGEAGFTYQARQVMDTVIDNLARAIRRLAAAGVGNAVVTADHGHLFFGSDRDESMRIDAPGGDTVDLHRRCWVGRGGSNPPGTVRVSAAALGYASDLDLVFPAGAGVFRAGGDLAFHHGGPSLQELVIPVVTVRTATGRPAGASPDRIAVGSIPDEITNRIFTVTMTLGGSQLQLLGEGLAVRAVLVADGREVGVVGMVSRASAFDSASERLVLEPGIEDTVAFRLLDDGVAALRIVVQDPATDAELYRSPSDLPVRLGVR